MSGPFQQPGVRERLWHPSQTVEAHPDGSLTLTLRVADTFEVKRWILGWGAAAEARKIAARDARTICA